MLRRQSWSSGIKMSQLKSKNIYGFSVPSIWMNSSMKYGIVSVLFFIFTLLYTFALCHSIRINSVSVSVNERQFHMFSAYSLYFAGHDKFTYICVLCIESIDCSLVYEKPHRHDLKSFAQIGTAHCIDEGTIRLADKNEEMRTTPAHSLCFSDELSVNYAKACIDICLYMRSGVFELGSIKLMVGLRRVSTLIGRRPISSAIHLWVFFFRHYCKTMAISYDFVWDLQ